MLALRSVLRKGARAGYPFVRRINRLRCLDLWACFESLYHELVCTRLCILYCPVLPKA